MRVLIVDPSPLARNVYRLILRRIPECRVVEAADSRAVDVGGGEQVDLLIIGERALQSDGGALRALCTDAAAWQGVPKIVVALRPGSGRQPPWAGLARTMVVHRPFHPADFERAVKACARELS